jgi:hypothetical protein
VFGLPALDPSESECAHCSLTAGRLRERVRPESNPLWRGNQDLGDLARSDDAVAGIAGMAAIALEQDEPMLVCLVG